MKKSQKTIKNAEISENVVDNSTKKRRGRPSKNRVFLDNMAAEFEKLPDSKNRSIKDKKAVKALAESMLTQGFTISEVSEILSIPKPTVCVWNSKLDDETKAKIKQNILNSVDTNLYQFLNSSLSSMSKLAFQLSQEEYLKKQSIKDVAKFIDTLGNFAFNFIEVTEEYSLKEISLRRAVSDK